MTEPMPTPPPWTLLWPAWLCLLAGIGGSLLLGDWSQGNGMALFFSPAVLILGLRKGALTAWVAGVACGLFVIGLFLADAISPVLLGASLAAIFAATLFPIPWNEAQERVRLEYETSRLPLAEHRELLIEQLTAIAEDAAASERRSRETDALYHAGREFSKLLTLEDTLSFTREVLRDTLRLSEPGGEASAFLVMIENEEGIPRTGCWAGISSDDASAFDLGFRGDLLPWLNAREGEASVLSVAGEASLKGVAMPAGVRGFHCLPLLIQDHAIGYLFVFDLSEHRLEGQDLSNLRILASQIAIGLEKATLYDKVQRLSVTDGLTGLYVHRYFQSRLDEEHRRAERYKESLSLLMIDIDHFKQFNDTYGHQAGDAVLKSVAACLTAQIGPADILSRYGGEEFSVILPKQARPAAQERAEALRLAVKALALAFDGKTVQVTVSIGLASFPEDAQVKKGLIDRADQALYRAKRGGRDQVALPDA